MLIEQLMLKGGIVIMQKNSVICNQNVDRCCFSSLDERHRCFLLTFVRCKGKLNKIQREMNITRNEAKNMTCELLKAFGTAPKKQSYNNAVNRQSAICEHTGHRYIFNMMLR